MICLTRLPAGLRMLSGVKALALIGAGYSIDVSFATNSRVTSVSNPLLQPTESHLEQPVLSCHLHLVRVM